MLVGSPDPTELKTFAFISTASAGVLGNIYEIKEAFVGMTKKSKSECGKLKLSAIFYLFA